MVIAALAVPAAAGAQASRQNASLRFTTQAPGASTGLSLSIDYFDPARPGGKPYSVQTVIEELAAGATIDTSVPASCTASDAQLMAEGPSACSSASVVGSGSIDLDTGNPLMRDIPNKVTFLNAPGQQIFLTETTNQPGGARTVTRAKVSGRTLRSDVPPIPGTPPPDNFTAVERVRAEFKAIRRGGRNYITTPPTCPRVPPVAEPHQLHLPRRRHPARDQLRDLQLEPAPPGPEAHRPPLPARPGPQLLQRPGARHRDRPGPRPGEQRPLLRRPAGHPPAPEPHRRRPPPPRPQPSPPGPRPVRLADGRLVRLSRRYRVCGAA